MAKDEAFYRRYVEAVFRRGRKDTLPHRYIMGEASKVLGPDELKEFQECLDAMAGEGLLALDGEEYTLKGHA